jgi:hypothetical protein
MYHRQLDLDNIHEAAVVLNLGGASGVVVGDMAMSAPA